MQPLPKHIRWVFTYPFGQWNLNGYWDDARSEAAIEGADKGDRVVVGVDEGHAVPGLDARIALRPHLMQQVVGDLVGPAQQLAWKEEFFIILFFLIVCFTSYLVFSIAVLPHSPGVL